MDAQDQEEIDREMYDRTFRSWADETIAKWNKKFVSVSNSRPFDYDKDYDGCTAVPDLVQECCLIHDLGCHFACEKKDALRVANRQFRHCIQRYAKRERGLWKYWWYAISWIAWLGVTIGTKRIISKVWSPIARLVRPMVQKVPTTPTEPPSMDKMKLVLPFLIIILSSSCTSISGKIPTANGDAQINVTRFWSDVSLSIDSKTGLITYTSDADGAAANAQLQTIMDLALASATRGALGQGQRPVQVTVEPAPVVIQPTAPAQPPAAALPRSVPPSVPEKLVSPEPPVSIDPLLTPDHLYFRNSNPVITP